jgi:fatty-acyl-CoA synthase
MFGVMQDDWPLLLRRILGHASVQHGGRDVVARSVEGPLHRVATSDR